MCCGGVALGAPSTRSCMYNWQQTHHLSQQHIAGGRHEPSCWRLGLASLSAIITCRSMTLVLTTCIAAVFYTGHALLAAAGCSVSGKSWWWTAGCAWQQSSCLGWSVTMRAPVFKAAKSSAVQYRSRQSSCSHRCFLVRLSQALRRSQHLDRLLPFQCCISNKG